MTHLKRLSMPEMWPLPKKQKTFVVMPMPGPHSKLKCIPLQIIVRDVLKFAGSGKEAKGIIKSGKILIDKKPRKETRFPVGLMDVIEIPDISHYYRVGVNKKGLFINSISSQDAGKKLCRIQGKNVIKGGTTQLHLHDGRNMFVEKGKEYSPGDSVLIQIPEQKIIKIYKLSKGSHAIIFAGRNKGVSGVIKEIRDRKTMLGKNSIIIKTKDGKEIETLKDYVMVGEV